MKKNVRNALAISGIAIAIGASGFVFEASANEKNFRNTQSSHQERILKSRKSGFEGRHSFGRRMLAGTVTEITNNSLRISRGEKEFTVILSDGARILDQKWSVIEFSKIEIGHKIRVQGAIADSVITAKTVRDISII